MSVSGAFCPQGNTVAFTANVAAPTAIQAIGATPGPNNYLVTNAGSSVVFMGAGSNAAVANTNAVVITSSGTNTAPTVPLLAGTAQTFSFGPNFFFTGITSGGTSVVYITPGDGL